jgi:diaminopimelate epimerase
LLGMRFAKWHGIGNDFVLLADPKDELELTPDLVRRLSDRHFGIGGDGVIRIAPSSKGADLFMDYLNADGSMGEMCGNGIRCLALYAKEQGMTDKDVLDVDTRAGVRRVEVLGDRVRVDMGPPVFEPEKIPVLWNEPNALHAKVELEKDVVEVACLSMGNPHAVIFMDQVLEGPITSGPAIERHEMFPNGTNVEFVKVVTPDHVWMRVWERGVGETLACGTGAAAVGVASRLLGGAEPRMTIELPGGELQVEWAGSLEEEASVFMTGPAVRSFEGDVDLEGFV